MNNTDDDLEQLREQTDVGNRLQATPDEDSDNSDNLEDAIVEFLGAVECGEVSKTLSVRDARLTALMCALEETGKLEVTGAALQEELGRDMAPDKIDRSEILRLAVRLGLQEAAPETLESARNAYSRYMSDVF